MIPLIRNLSSNRSRHWLIKLTDWRWRWSGMATSSRSTTSAKRAALYVRVSTADRGQTVENQLQPLGRSSSSGQASDRTLVGNRPLARVPDYLPSFSPLLWRSARLVRLKGQLIQGVTCQLAG